MFLFWFSVVLHGFVNVVPTQKPMQAQECKGGPNFGLYTGQRALYRLTSQVSIWLAWSARAEHGRIRADFSQGSSTIGWWFVQLFQKI